MRQILIITHQPCPDGFASSWVCRRYFQTQTDVEVEFCPGIYGADPPWDKIKDKDVYIVDFCYSRSQMDQISIAAKSLVVLDHHKSAQEALEGFQRSVFDMNRSGAGLAWDYFYPDSKRPWLVDYVEDRDLWRFKLEDSKIVNAYISTLPYTFEAWDDASQLGPKTVNPDGWGMVLIAGKSVVAKTAHYVEEVKKNAIRIDFDGYNVPIVNAAQIDNSELIGELARNESFAMGWFQGSDGSFKYSLRSSGPSAIDVSEIAKRYGGGGHAAASGFVSDHPIHMDQVDIKKAWRLWGFWSLIITVAWLLAYYLEKVL